MTFVQSYVYIKIAKNVFELYDTNLNNEFQCMLYWDKA